MFADDTQCLISWKNLNDLIDNVNSELKKIALWFRANKLVVNVSKTKYLIFHIKGKKINMGNRNIVFDDNDQDYPVSPNKITILERFHSDHPNPDSKTYKLLGIYLEEHLSLNYHINVLSKKLAKANYILT